MLIVVADDVSVPPSSSSVAGPSSPSSVAGPSGLSCTSMPCVSCMSIVCFCVDTIKALCGETVFPMNIAIVLVLVCILYQCFVYGYHVSALLH